MTSGASRIVVGFSCCALLGIGPGYAKSADFCPAERAVYAFETQDGAFLATFIPARSRASMASDLYLRLSTTQRNYWFAFAMSSGYGGMTLLPVSDPYHASAAENGPHMLLDALEEEEADGTVSDGGLSSLRFYALDAALDFIEEPPAKGEHAPEFVLMPELGVALWYDPASLTEDTAAERDTMPRGIFRRTRCLDIAPPEAWP